MYKQIFIALTAITLIISCKKNDSNTSAVCNYDPCGVVAPAAEIDSVRKAVLADSATATSVQHCSGLYYKIDAAGTGKTPTACSNVYVQYRARLRNGKVIDQQTNPVGFSLSNLIPGWRNALPLIKEGGTMHLYVPPSLAYGNKDISDNSGNVVIPANSVVIFDITLVQVVQ